jgi:hypothetical protein
MSSFYIAARTVQLYIPNYDVDIDVHYMRYWCYGVT